MNTISILVHRAAKRWAEKRKAERNTDTANRPHPAVVKQKAETAQNEMQPEKDSPESTTERQTVQPAAQSPSLTTTGDKENTEMRLEKFLAIHYRCRYINNLKELFICFYRTGVYKTTSVFTAFYRILKN